MLKEFLEDKKTSDAARKWYLHQEKGADTKLITPEVEKRCYLGVYRFFPKDEKYFPAIEKVHRLLGGKTDFPENDVPKTDNTYRWFVRIKHLLEAYNIF